MAKLVVNQERILNIDELIKICPFGALENKNGALDINSACKMCKLCVKKGPEGAITYVEDEKVEKINKNDWNGISVYVEYSNNEIHPVTFELIGKARELADKVNQKVSCIFIGSDIGEKAKELLHYGADKVYVYDNQTLKNFRIEPYTKMFEKFVEEVKPSVILVGATNLGRSLAPRVAARYKTGLTADCTVLDIKENTDLIQIRPAFGGNIMAQIITPNSRPQLATVRYKVMSALDRIEEAKGEVINCEIKAEDLISNIVVKEVKLKKKEKSISDAEILVVAGRAIKTDKEMAMVKELASLLGGEVAVTRPLIENGMADGSRQVGLSGRTVRAKLIITCGVSGAVQFTAGMSGCESIFAINKDEKAPIFKVAHYGMVGDVNEIIPKLIEQIKENGGEKYAI